MSGMIRWEPCELIDTQYEDLLERVLTQGEEKPDRTGTGTYSLFGAQLRYDLQKGFPLITTKKMFTRGMIEELIWILRGSTNEHELAERGVHFWKEWAREDGSLGPTYGKQMREVDTYYAVEPEIFEPADTTKELPVLVSKLVGGADGVRNLNERSAYGVGYYGEYDKHDPQHLSLVETWRQMIRRCYDASCVSFKGYGAQGVHVSEEWQCYATFQQDVKTLTNWELKLDYPSEYSLDKDTKRASNRYSKDTCIWASEDVQNANRSNTKPFSAVNADGVRVDIPTIGFMRREYGVNVSAVHRCLNGGLKTHHGWSDFRYKVAGEGKVMRYNKVDQLKTFISGIRHNPPSRRHIINLWNPAEAVFMELPPCHGLIIQGYVSEGRLSLHVYQRSADVFLGLPVNIASYALLTHIIAAQTGLEVGELLWSGTDVHLYQNHEHQAVEQLSRDVREFPNLHHPAWDELDAFNVDDFYLEGYNPHPAIAAPVAI